MLTAHSWSTCSSEAVQAQMKQVAVQSISHEQDMALLRQEREHLKAGAHGRRAAGLYFDAMQGEIHIYMRGKASLVRDISANR